MNTEDMLSCITQFLQKKLYLPKGSLVYKCITINTGLTKGNLTIENGKAMIEKCDEPEELTDPVDIGRVFIFLRENFPDFITKPSLKIYAVYLYYDQSSRCRCVLAHNEQEVRSLFSKELNDPMVTIGSIKEIGDLNDLTPRVLL